MAQHRAPVRSIRQSAPVMLRPARVGVAIALVASAVVACTSSASPVLPKTAQVQRTAVTTGVTATGSLTAATEQNLGFPKGGQLTEVDVKVGDHVAAGQVLAVVDPFVAQQEVAQAESQMRAQEAVLSGVVSATTVGGAADSLGQAKTVAGATGDQADAITSADDVTTRSAKKQLSVDKSAQSKAQDQLDNDQHLCPSGSASTTTTTTTTTTSMTGTSSTSMTGTSPTSMTGTSMTGNSMTGTSPSWMTGPSPTSPTATAPAPVDPGPTKTTTGTTTKTTPDAAACGRLPSDMSAVTAAKRVVTADRAMIDGSEAKKSVDSQSGQLAMANAQQGVVSAQNASDSANASRPSAIAQQQALVASAATAVAMAQKDLSDTTLRATTPGVVSALNGAVGEYLAPSSGTSALAPGSDAVLPGTGGSGGTGAAAAAAAASPTRPGGTQFIVLDDLDQFQVVLAYTETDASAIAPDQKVQLTFDAVPDLTLNGTVVSVAPSGTAISGVISYYVTVALPQSDPRLKAGMTTEAEVVTTSTPDVLAVPTSAVHRDNGQSVVTVLQADGSQKAVTVQLGVAGDGQTQVLSGLQLGQQVVLPATP